MAAPSILPAKYTKTFVIDIDTPDFGRMRERITADTVNAAIAEVLRRHGCDAVIVGVERDIA